MMPITLSFTFTIKAIDSESGVSQMIEYILISSILLLFLVVTILMVNNTFIEEPSNFLTSYAYMDIGNGVSTRIVDLYAIIPYSRVNTHIGTKFDVPDDVAGKDYMIEIVEGPPNRPTDRRIVIFGGGPIKSTISLAGIGETTFGVAEGKTTASGLNYIEYTYP
ncbi:MAG: hypothetical protein NQU46_04950 [Methanolinea sp.]|nr:hypothetical protein [Methanolinea sp.]